MTKNILYFGSKSQSRKMLLEESQIPFVVVDQNADETVCDWGLPLPQLVLSIALYKMQHVILPDGKHEGDICFVLTADTMSHDKMGVVHGKPVDRDDAIAKIKASAAGSFLCTAFCVDRKVWKQNAWVIEERIADVVSAEFIFLVPENWIDIYLAKTPYLDVSGGMAIEKYGNQFLKTVTGSYSTIIGLPLFEVREALEKLGFF
ncbi:MAG TPA: Maf family protein [Candidatus Babeliales bacterium]|nr:Maf family protein [Candidatus Babeliales bacterium]